MTDQEYMQEALLLAKQSLALDEVPVGAVLVHRGHIIAKGYNVRECARCATKHAEMLAIEQACRHLYGWRLPDTVLYVTLEPCPMCAGAILQSRIERVVYGAKDEKGGAFGGACNLSSLPHFHKPIIQGGVLEAECRALLQEYFRNKRTK